MKIDWTIRQCDYQADSGYIKVAHWEAKAVDGVYYDSIKGTCDFTGGALNIPYDQVTEEDVLNWCWANGVDKDAVEQIIIEKLNAKQFPKTLSGNPWDL